jgi:hypothetical protein
MPERSRKPADLNRLAASIGGDATDPDLDPYPGKNPAAVELGRLLALVVAFSADGQATVLASAAPKEIRQEVAAPATRSAYLIERAAMGPWVEFWTQRAEDGKPRRSARPSGLGYIRVENLLELRESWDSAGWASTLEAERTFSSIRTAPPLTDSARRCRTRTSTP